LYNPLKMCFDSVDIVKDRVPQFVLILGS